MVLQVEMPASMEDGVCNTIEKILDFRVVDVDDDDAADGAATADGGKLAMVFPSVRRRRSPLVPPDSS